MIKASGSANRFKQTDEIMLITNKGQMVRTRVREIRETGRNTMGVSQAEEEEAQSAEAPAQKL
jgi:DNA gyrase subunit A